jgi:hypothetical protein
MTFAHQHNSSVPGLVSGFKTFDDDLHPNIENKDQKTLSTHLQ